MSLLVSLPCSWLGQGTNLNPCLSSRGNGLDSRAELATVRGKSLGSRIVARSPYIYQSPCTIVQCLCAVASVSASLWKGGQERSPSIRLSDITWLSCTSCEICSTTGALCSWMYTSEAKSEAAASLAGLPRPFRSNPRYSSNRVSTADCHFLNPPDHFRQLQSAASSLTWLSTRKSRSWISPRRAGSS